MSVQVFGGHAEEFQKGCKVREVRYEKFNTTGTANDHTMVWIDNDDDTVVEMAIRLKGLFDLTDSDFIL